MLRITPAALPPKLAELVDEVVHRGRSPMGDEPLVFQLLEQLVDQDERQLDLVGNLSAGDVAAPSRTLSVKASTWQSVSPAASNEVGSTGVNESAGWLGAACRPVSSVETN